MNVFIDKERVSNHIHPCCTINSSSNDYFRIEGTTSTITSLFLVALSVLIPMVLFIYYFLRSVIFKKPFLVNAYIIKDISFQNLIALAV